MENESWKDIEGYEGIYQVSDLGRIKCIRQYVKTRNPKNYKILKCSINNVGYYALSLSDKANNKKTVTKKLHTLIAKAFIPNPENKPCVNHKDGNKLNNNLDNLEWCTLRENVQHAYKTGLMNTEKPRRKSKYNKQDVLNLRYNENRTMQYISEKLNIHKSTVSKYLKSQSK